MTFDDIRNGGLLLYEYTRGSHAYHLDMETSDIDTGGVFCEPVETLLGIGGDNTEEVSDARHDTTWYGLRKYMWLLCKANPNILESLFVDDEFVRFIHPAFNIVRENRQMFVTKKCFDPFIGYAICQIKKARGLNKKIVNPIEKRLSPLDFCYTHRGNGSEPISEFLNRNGLHQEFCGLCSLNNMPMTYGVFYDYPAHKMHYWKDFEALMSDTKFLDFWHRHDHFESGDDEIEEFLMSHFYNTLGQPYGYRGIVLENGKSDEVRCSSIPERETPICYMTYNQNGFETHCRQWKEYSDWVKKRNPARYESNLKSNFDRKNVSHCFRLIHMGKEIAETGEVHVSRRGIDEEFLRDIRNGRYEYEELIERLEKEKDELDSAIRASTIPHEVDVSAVSDMTIEIRKQIGINI